MRFALFVCSLTFVLHGETAVSVESVKTPLIPVGAAVTDITPDYPVRLTGYASRKTESDGINSHIHARAIAIGGTSDDSNDVTQPLAVLVTVDNCGVTTDLVEAVFEEISDSLELPRSNFVVSSTHTHSAPWLTDFARLIQTNISPEQQIRLDRYRVQLHQQIVDVVRAAVANRRPARLSIGAGHADFARNRRVLKDGRYAGSGIYEDGPVDHRVAILAAHDANGSLIAVLTNYACHATTDAGANNQISGDWPGFAADMIESDHPGAVAMVAVGCGADVNPIRSRDVDYSADHGRQYADSVRRVLNNRPKDNESTMRALDVNLDCQLSRIELPFGPLPGRDEWESQAGQPGIDGMLAKRMLEKLDSGEGIPTTLTEYPVQTWQFGDDLAMVFLAGEVVQDYAIRMGEMFDADRLWVNAYCNDVPCYIPSKRILREGGYEADRSLKYYGQPTRLSPEIENRICWAVQKQLPHHFYSDELLTEFPGPKPPTESLSTMTTRKDLRVELVAAEPLIQDPVAFDWDPTGRLWVVEMSGYPLGPTSGRIRVLTDEDGDGVFDSGQTFLDGLAYPSGVCVWRNGVLVTAAPDLIYAEDTDGDGKADRNTVLCTGFTEGNQQHRINGMRWGLDGWLYLANGDSGGSIRVTGQTGPDGGRPVKADSDSEISIRFRDIRLKPDEGLLETLSGQTQFGRERDDFGQWFGNNNSNPIWHYVIEDRYVQRNPFAKIGRPLAQVSFEPGAAPVYPTSKTTARFNDFHAANRFTSACGTAICRDTVLGENFYGNAFTCEPVHNLVSRLVLTPQDVTFHGVRTDDETQSEFLASSDNWFRPTMVRTGPDGFQYVCDMYRQVIEHPEWIPVAAQRRLNLRAGSSHGRIYRVVPTDMPSMQPERSWIDQPWKHVSLQKLVERLSSPSAWWRDTAQRILQHRQTEWTDATVAALPWDHDNPAVRVQAVCTAAMADRLSPEHLIAALQDSDARVRRRAIVLLEQVELPAKQLTIVLQKLLEDEDDGARLQLACTLGSLTAPIAGDSLGRLLATDQNNEWIRKACLTSLNSNNVVDVFQAVTKNESADGRLVAELIEQCQRFEQTDAIHESVIRILRRVSRSESVLTSDLTMAADVAAFAQQTEELSESEDVAAAIADAGQQAVTLLRMPELAEGAIVAAIRIVSVAGITTDDVLVRLDELIAPNQSVGIQQAALAALLDNGSSDRVFESWRTLSPDRRNQALDILIRREGALLQLLKQLEDGVLTAADLGAIYRDQLLNHPNADIQIRVKQVLGASQSVDRHTVVMEWQNRLADLTGDLARGEAVFKKRCATCHQLQNIGNQVGADLSSLRDRTTPALVTAILDPNKAVESRFLSYTAVLTDGRTISGMLKSETGTSVTLIGTDGKPQELLRSDLDDLLASNRSFMPEGLEKDLTPQDLADVILFVQSVGTPWKRFDGNTPQIVSADGDGVLTLPASAAEFYGSSIEYDSASGTTKNWQSSDDYLVWQLKVKGWGARQVEFEYTCDDSAAGNQLKAATRGRMMTASVPGTGDSKTPRRWTAGLLELSPGAVTFTLSAPEELTSELLELKAVRLIPAKKD
jgi:putative membrane-bound dehydrogenase-like protein